MGRDLFLVSSSRVHGSGYLDHCEDAVRQLFAGAERVLFVPYALADRDAYAASAQERFAAMELELDSVHEAKDPRTAVETAGGLFIGGGNTFRLLAGLYDAGLIEAIRSRVTAGMPYMGTSAGTNVACPTIKTTNDMPIVQPPSFEALALVPFQINPHYVDADPSTTHMGETRDQHLEEFHEESKTPVVALREGSFLRVENRTLHLVGLPGGKLFRPGREPAPLEDGARLDFLL